MRPTTNRQNQCCQWLCLSLGNIPLDSVASFSRCVSHFAFRTPFDWPKRCRSHDIPTHISTFFSIFFCSFLHSTLTDKQTQRFFLLTHNSVPRKHLAFRMWITKISIGGNKTPQNEFLTENRINSNGQSIRFDRNDDHDDNNRFNRECREWEKKCCWIENEWHKTRIIQWKNMTRHIDIYVWTCFWIAKC